MATFFGSVQYGWFCHGQSQIQYSIHCLHLTDDRYCLYPECTLAKSSTSEKKRSECNSLYSFAIFCSSIYRALGKKILAYLCVSMLIYSYFFGGSASIKLAKTSSYILALVLFVGFCVCVIKDLLHHECHKLGYTPKRRHFCCDHQVIVDSTTCVIGE